MKKLDSNYILKRRSDNNKDYLLWYTTVYYILIIIPNNSLFLVNNNICAFSQNIKNTGLGTRIRSNRNKKLQRKYRNLKLWRD